MPNKKLLAKNTKKNIVNFNRTDLLGYSNKQFQLDQGEFVAKKIIDELLAKTFSLVRCINVTKMCDDYSGYRAFNNLKAIVSLGIIQNDTEYEKETKYDIDFNIKPSKIDAWASDSVKILTNVPPEEVPVAPVKRLSSPQKEKDKDVSISKRLNVSRLRSAMVKKSTQIIANKKKANYVRELPMEAETLDIEEVDQFDELDKIKLKGFRIFFQEKEIERQKRKIIEKEQMERQKEEDKKIKQVMQVISSSNLISFDDQGRFLTVKELKDKDYKKIPELRFNIKDKEKIYDFEKIYNWTSNGVSKNVKSNDVISMEQEPEEITIKYYQPNPLTIPISKGTVLEYYGIKRQGGRYEKGDGRWTLEEYWEILSKIHPYRPALNEEENPKEVLSEVPEEEAEKNKVKDIKENLPSLTKLYFMFRDEIMEQNSPNQQKKKGPSNQANILKKTGKVTKQVLKTIKKKQKEDKKKQNAIIKENKKLKLDDIKDMNDDEVKNEFRVLDYGNQQPEYFGNYKETKSILPMNWHENAMKDSQGFTKTRLRTKNLNKDKDMEYLKFLPKKMLMEIEEKNKKKNTREKEVSKLNKENQGNKIIQEKKENYVSKGDKKEFVNKSKTTSEKSKSWVKE